MEMTVRQNKSGIPSRIRVIAFSREDAVYTLTATLGDANATEAQQAVLDRTLKSFRFTDGEVRTGQGVSDISQPYQIARTSRPH